MSKQEPIVMTTGSGYRIILVDENGDYLGKEHLKSKVKLSVIYKKCYNSLKRVKNSLNKLKTEL